MPSEIPDAIGNYLRLAQTVDAANADALVTCFTADAEITDEGETRRGHAAIKSWWEGPATVYQYTVEVRGTRALGNDRHVVYTRLAGNFPGGTADLANRFTLRDGLIARLEISPPQPGEEPDASHSH